MATKTKTAPEPFSGPRYNDNADDAGGSACCLCGKATDNESSPTKYARVVEGGARFALADEFVHENNRADMGWFPVGSSCARKFPKGYLVECPPMSTIFPPAK